MDISSSAASASSVSAPRNSSQQQRSHPPRRRKKPDKSNDTPQNQSGAQTHTPRHNGRNRARPRDQSTTNPEAVVPPQPRSSRLGKAKFNAGLTSDDPAKSSGRSRRYGRRNNIPSEADAGDLTSNLIRELSNKPYLDCLICFSSIHPKQPTWSCSPLIPLQEAGSQYCWTTFHLKCIQEWAEKSYKEVKAAWEAREEFDKDGEWRCPGCQGKRNKLIKGYSCFCGSTHSPNNLLATPHSCGNSCSRSRMSCSHPCPLLCHPGPCPPCKVVLEVPCECVRQRTVAVRCGEDLEVSCGQTCTKMLGCGKHHCQQTCHSGPCSPCEQKDILDCWCGKEQKQVPCGEGDIWLDPVGCDELSTETMLKPTKGFGCQSPCGKSFDCGDHTCTKSCHPPALDARSGHCPMSPDRITTCPCGKQSISTSFASQPGKFPPRFKCTDPIPTCDSICLKPHSDCEHLCQAKCHTSAICPPCSVDVVRPCRCGSTSRTLRCGDLRILNPETSLIEEQEILCTRPCTAMRSCGNHRCTRVCCPLASLAASSKAKGKKKAMSAAAMQLDVDPEGLHVCDLVCGKMLSCGEHQCEERDHRGPCKPCLRSSFEELVCFCGKTVLEPPVPCGTQIHCSYECSLPPPPCGHPKTPHTCHFPSFDADDGVVVVGGGSPCPPCVFLTSKPCACGKKIMPNVKCSLDSSKISCGLVCGKLMPSCGYHRCERPCHARECGDHGRCTSVCGKDRKGCLPDHHPCMKTCHAPSACDEEEPCQSRVEVSCECGRMKQSLVCGKCTGDPQGNIGAGEKGRVLKCTTECAVKKRNERLADALGIKSKSGGSGLLDQATYSDELVAFARANGKFLGLVEDTLAEFVKSNRGKQVLPHMPPEKRNFVHKLAGIYRLDTQMVDADPQRSVQIIRRIDTRIPTPLLSAYISSKFSSSTTSFGKLGNLRGGTFTTQSSSASSIAGPTAVTANTTRGWTSVVAPSPSTSPGPGRPAVASGVSSPRNANTPSPAASRTVTPVPGGSSRALMGGSTTAFAGARTGSAVGGANGDVVKEDVPDNWEDDV